MVASITTIAAEVNWDTSMVILQLFNNSIYMVGGLGGEKKLPTKDKLVVNNIDGSLVVADKQEIKSLVNVLAPLTLLVGIGCHPAAMTSSTTPTTTSLAICHDRGKRFTRSETTSGTPSSQDKLRIFAFCAPTKWWGWDSGRRSPQMKKQR